MTAQEYIYKHYGTHKTSQLPDNYDLENVIKLMNRFAKKKCKEQRSICRQEYENNYFEDKNAIGEFISHAPKPEFK